MVRNIGNNVLDISDDKWVTPQHRGQGNHSGQLTRLGSCGINIIAQSLF